LKINQKLELTEEKIRKFFAYWLNLCDSYVGKENQNSPLFYQKIYNKVILVIEGIDQLFDSERRSAIVSVWLPKFFPRNFRVIVTANSSSE